MVKISIDLNPGEVRYYRSQSKGGNDIYRSQSNGCKDIYRS